jgi:membrane fusion protein (multidrug efflux system)
MPVKKGDLIFVIESNLLSTTMRAAEAQLYSAQAQLAESKNNYDRAKPLAELNAISQSQLDQYRAEYLSALSSVKSANQSLESARLQVGYSRIYSPIDGIIASSNAHTGDYVGPGTQFQILTTISNLDTLSAQLAIPTSLYLQYARRGNSYENRNLLSDINLYLSSGEKYGYSGIYDYTKQNISSTSGTISIVVDFPNPNLSLKAGEYAKVKVGLGGKRYKLLIPQQAVSRIQNIASVWVIKPDNTAEYRTVELGESYGQLWIIENGVSLGERVALTGLQKLHNGMKVTPYKVE